MLLANAATHEAELEGQELMTNGSPAHNPTGAVAEIIGSAPSGKRPPNRDAAEEMLDVGSKGES